MTDDACGWVKIHRKIMNWEWRDDPKVFSTFVHCVILANYEDRKWHGTVIRKGQFVTKLDNLADLVGISTRSLTTCLEKLSISGAIEKEATNKHTIITICNYSKYQAVEDTVNKQCDTQSTSDGKTMEKQWNTNGISMENHYIINKEIKEIKESKERKERKEKRDTIVSRKKFSFTDGLVALGVDQQVAQDWVAVRKNKKLTQSETAFAHVSKNIETIAASHNMLPNDIIRTAVERSWGGIEPGYFKCIPPMPQQREEEGSTPEVLSMWGTPYE